MGMVFITHDLGIVRRIADRVYVMQSGEVVEEGETQAIFTNPKHRLYRGTAGRRRAGGPQSACSPRLPQHS